MGHLQRRCPIINSSECLAGNNKNNKTDKQSNAPKEQKRGKITFFEWAHILPDFKYLTARKRKENITLHMFSSVEVILAE